MKGSIEIGSDGCFFFRSQQSWCQLSKRSMHFYWPDWRQPSVAFADSDRVAVGYT